jgi:NadR type nicotinamide-nucleotide adenylyltransferase
MENIPHQRSFKGLRIVLYGPESTGKSTLSRLLAAHYQTTFVAEFARDFLQEKFDRTQEICSYDDLIPIAIGQRDLENQAIIRVNKILFCDTDPLETCTYSEIYFDKVPTELIHTVQESQYDLYLLMDVDLPWVHDDLRDRPNDRNSIFNTFKTNLERWNKNFTIISGTGDRRFKTAIRAIENYRLNEFD